ncbi:hypothetical protein ZIOFF_020046 [Zingiber officinale]|uniref:glutathione synthase n=1 Tax=Zingiber officinale TaxID=94328 RepID=A0A8J5HYP6_ZINOF|nr:hypothetical protein ZIOFF_020046 [Zingiber officinale]
MFLVYFRFLDNKDDIAKVRKCFAGLWSLDDAETVRSAVEKPDLFVLKPQREGGGNNIYGDSVRETLVRVQKEGMEKLAAYILMQRIFPTAVPSFLVREGIWHQDKAISELGTALTEVDASGGTELFHSTARKGSRTGERDRLTFVKALGESGVDRYYREEEKTKPAALDDPAHLPLLLPPTLPSIKNGCDSSVSQRAKARSAKGCRSASLSSGIIEQKGRPQALLLLLPSPPQIGLRVSSTCLVSGKATTAPPPGSERRILWASEGRLGWSPRHFLNLLNSYGKELGMDSERVPRNMGVSGFAEALAKAWNEYNNISAVVTVVVQNEERNMYDQHWLAAVLKEKYPCTLFISRLCLTL